MARTIGRSMQRALGGLCRAGLVLLALTASACYHYRAVPQQPASETEVGGAIGPATEYEGEIVWALLWGAVQQNPRIANCQGQDLAEVRVSTNFGFVLLTIVTLGIASPARVEWRCAKPRPDDGEISWTEVPHGASDRDSNQRGGRLASITQPVGQR